MCHGDIGIAGISTFSIGNTPLKTNMEGPKMMGWKRERDPLNMAIVGIYFRFLGCTSSIRVHFAASYVSTSVSQEPRSSTVKA